jgi:hypothetical protein
MPVPQPLAGPPHQVDPQPPPGPAGEPAVGRIARLERRLTPATLVAVYAVLLAVGFWTHELWFDELQAWSIVRDSGSLGELFDNRSYEGHPLLWYLLLWPLSRLTRDPLAVQVLQAAIALGVAGLIAYRAPFRPLVRAGLVLGYFPLYEYGVIARPYALTVLLVLVACTLARREQRPLLLIVAVLASAAQTTAFGLLVAGAVAAAIGADEILRRPERRRMAALATAGAVLVVVALATVAQIIPPQDAPFGGGLDTPSEAVYRQPFAAVTPALLPLRPPGQDFWYAYQPPRPWGGVAGVVLFVALTAALARRPAPLVLWLVGGGGILLVAWFRFAGSLRHHGHLVLLVLAACWIFSSCGPWPVGRLAPRLRRHLHTAAGVVRRATPVAVAVVLVAQVSAAALALGSAVGNPFGGAPAAAERIREAGLEDSPLIGYSDLATIAVAVLLDRPIFLAGRQEWATWLRWDGRRQRLTNPELEAAARQVAATGQGPAVLISTRDLTGHGLELIGRFPDPALAEVLHLYVVGGDDEPTTAGSDP